MDKFIKCIWITNTIAAAGEDGITLAELNRKWTADPENDPIPDRTFYRLKNQIADIFGIDIECDKGRNTYYIPYRDELYDDKLKMWLLNSFALHNRLSGDPQLRRRVQFEEIPGGTHWLDSLLDAMQKCLKISISYQKSFEDDLTEYAHCKPFGLKLFKQRWYLIAENKEGAMRFFSLDRIHNLEVSAESFQMSENFDMEKLFEEAFGMYVNPEIKAERVVVKADIPQSQYLKSLPLHHSQRFIEESDDYVVFAWKLKPTYDFIQQLLTMNLHIEVLEPQSLRKQMVELLNTMLGKYKKKHNTSFSKNR